MAYKLELPKALERLDKRDKTFYNSLSDEEKKGFQSLVLMRFMSSVPDNRDASYLALLTTNELVNIHFWEMAKEPELQAMLLAMTGPGRKSYHKWIPTTSKKGSALNDFIHEVMLAKRWHPNRKEIEIFLSKLTLDEFKELCASHGKSKEDEKKLVAEFKKTYV